MRIFDYIDGILITMIFQCVIMAIVLTLVDALKNEPVSFWLVIKSVFFGIFAGMFGIVVYWMLSRDMEIKPSNMILLVAGSHAATCGIAIAFAVHPWRILAAVTGSMLAFLVLTAIGLRKNNM